MKKFYAFLSMFAVVMMSCGVMAAESTVSRVSASHNKVAGARISSGNVVSGTVNVIEESKNSADNSVGEQRGEEVTADCREAYRQCMDDFCLLDESQGERCACSDNINRAKSKIQEILDIQSEADKLFTEGVEREELGAKASLVFTNEVGNEHISSINFMDWLYSGDEDGDLDEDSVIGSDLYDMASKYCKSELKSCGTKAGMESMLYERMITQDCKNYDAYLKDQKANAESNKRVAESAVRKARLGMLDTTNKYNRGECLLAYRSCIADKGGCGVEFENCLDAKLLQRRANACENVLDQCMAVRDYVKQDWDEESKSILADAAKYADRHYRETCLAKIQECLEEGCSTSTNAECLTNVNVAAGICPIINECNDTIPGLKSVVNTKLGYLQTKFCENDIDKCLQDKCGVDFSKPECVGKKTNEIVALCPQDMFPSCSNAKQYKIIVQSVLLQMDYQMYIGCVNYFSDQLSRVCGTDMACLPMVSAATNFMTVPSTEEEKDELKARIVAASDKAVDEFFKQFEKDQTVAACADSQSGAKKLAGKTSLGKNVFNAAKLLAKMSAENRNLREMETRIAELSRKQDIETARQTCLTTFHVEQPKDSKSNYSYIRSVSFEPSTRNCHVCRMQQVCETGGEDEMTSAGKYAAGGLSMGMSAGSLGGGWGAAIGSVAGLVAGGIYGYMAGGKEEYCQEIESCEDINM